MPRARGVVRGRAKRKEILSAARGNFGGRSRLFKSAKETVLRGLRYSYQHRRRKKRDFRRLWIVRINAAARENGLSYSNFINGLKRAQVDIDRKTLAELAVLQPEAFKELATVAREASTR
jgi:large subunit ribosomal protein L20